MSSIITGLVWEMPITKVFNSNAKFIALAYADHAWQDGTHAYPSIGLVARKTGIHERTVQHYVRSLIKIGMFIPDGKGPRGTNQFSFPLVQTEEVVKLELKPLGGGAIPPMAMLGVANQADDGGGTVPPESAPPEPKVVVKDLNQVLVVVNQALGEISTLYEQEFGGLTPMIADAIKDAVDTYPPDWILEAMTIAVKGNKRSWNYVEGILKNCKAKNVRPALNKLEVSKEKTEEKHAGSYPKGKSRVGNNEDAIQRVLNAG